MARVAALAIAAALALAAPQAWAAPPPEDVAPSPAHEASFRSGLDQYAQGNYVAAIATWETLLGTLGEERGYKVLYNLGLAYQALGDVTKAIDRFRAFGRRVAARPNASAELKDRAEDAGRRAAQLEQTHGALHVHTPKRGGLVLTRVGSSEPRAAGYVQWLAPGTHTIELFVGTDHARTQTIEVQAGRSIDIDTSPPEPVAEPMARRPPGAEPARPSPGPWMWIAGGATVASLALPIGLYAVAEGKKDDASSLGPGSTRYADARSSYDSWRTAYYVSYALPAVLAVTTAIIVLAPSARTTVGLAPSGVSLAGRF